MRNATFFFLVSLLTPFAANAKPTLVERQFPSLPFSCAGAPQPSATLAAAAGFRAAPLLGGLTKPRAIVLDARGNLLVVQRGVGVSVHTLNAGGCATSSKILISDTTLNHGIDVLNGKLYASSSTTVWSWDYNSIFQTVSNKKTIVTGIYNSGSDTHTVVVSRRYPKYLVVVAGSITDTDMATGIFSPSVGRAMIKAFDLTAIPNGGVVYAASGRYLGYGLRNDVGLAEDRTGTFFSVENSIDDAFYQAADGERHDVSEANPAELLWNLGKPNSPQETFHGYPYCFKVWDHAEFSDASVSTGDWKVHLLSLRDFDYDLRYRFVQDQNSTMNEAWCTANAAQPRALLPPHTAPLDIKFGVGFDTSAYVSLHGSYTGTSTPSVVAISGRYPLFGSWTPTNAVNTPAAQRNILWNMNEATCPSTNCFRPVGLVWSTSGNNLYVSSDSTGEVYIIKKGL